MYKLILIFFLSISVFAISISKVDIKGISISRQKSLSFGSMTDLHYDYEDLNGYSNAAISNGFASNLVSQFNSRNLDFIISLGDMIDGTTTKTNEIINLKNIETELLKFNGDVYSVIGNHDTEKITLAEYLSNSDIISAHSYSFIKNGFFCIVVYAKYKTMSQTQKDWLTAELAKSDLPTIIFCHYSLDHDGTGDIDLTNAPDVRAILEADGDVFASFQGHHHANGYSEINGIKYFTFPSASSATITGVVVTIFSNNSIYVDGIGLTTDRYF